MVNLACGYPLCAHTPLKETRCWMPGLGFGGLQSYCFANNTVSGGESAEIV